MEFKVVGTNTSDGLLSMWHWSTREAADAFAKQMCQDTGGQYYVLQLIGTWQRAIEFVAALGQTATSEAAAK